MRVCVLSFLSALLCIGSGVANLELKAPYTLGANGYGYTFAVEDGYGNLIVASNPNPVNGTVILKTHNKQVVAQVALATSRGSVTSGCIISTDTTSFLYVGLTQAGYAARVDLSFPANPVKFLNATDSNLLWNGEAPKVLNTAFCRGSKVYFGTKSETDNTVVRLDTLSTDVTARFRSLTNLGKGDFSQVAEWGEDQLLFAMEPDTGYPLTFHIINTGGSIMSLNTTKTVILSGFDFIHAIATDRVNKEVVVINGNGHGRIAVIDLATPSPTVAQELILSGPSPITTAVIDTDAKFAYVTVGACNTVDGFETVAIRLVPTLTEMERSSDTAVFDCALLGVPRTAILQTSDGDTATAPAPHRSVLVLTELDYEPNAPMKHGVVLPISVNGAGPCPNDCFSAAGNGQCAAEQCYCQPAYSGVQCDDPVPCNGTECSNNGKCVDDSCECETGWEGPDCSLRVHCPLDCSGRGLCNNTRCECSTGFTGAACELHTIGCDNDLLNDCHGHGTCEEGYPMGSCVCSPGWVGDACAEEDTSCPGRCSGHGVCSHGVCTCGSGWIGSACSEVASLCPHACSGHGVCRNHRCTCHRGFKGLDCAIVDTALCSKGCFHGTCTNGTCLCEDGWRGVDCSDVDTRLSVVSDFALRTGENHASTAFRTSGEHEHVVFCLATTPAKCVFFDPISMDRVRTSSLEDPAAALAAANVLLETAEGAPPLNSRPLTTGSRHPKLRAPAKQALLPDLIAVSSVAMMELGSVSDAPVTAGVLENGENGAMYLGVSADGDSHGQIIKLSIDSMAVTADVTLTNDTAPGVTRMVLSPGGRLFVASGESPARVYSLNTALEILAIIELNTTQITALDYTSGQLFAASATKAFRIDVEDSSLTESGSADISPAFGNVVSGFVFSESFFLGTDALPAAILRLSQASLEMGSVRLGAGLNTVTTVAKAGSAAYWVLRGDISTNTCFVVKMDLNLFKETDMVALEHCDAAVSTGTVAIDGASAYFGSDGSPARVWDVKLNTRTCEANCNEHGDCNDGVCECHEGFSGAACEVDESAPPAVPAVPAAPTPISCPRNCSHAGQCVEGVCQCRPGRIGVDCSVVESCRVRCLHGHCGGSNGTWPCVCDSGWTGGYCANQICPNDCSGRGTCENGTCVCEDGFEGAACDLQHATDACTVDSDCGENQVCVNNSTSGLKECECAEGFSGTDCIAVVNAGLEQDSSVSPVLIGVLVVGALAVGMVAGVSIWKSWAGEGGAMPSATSGSKLGGVGGPAANVGQGGGYTRLRHRLVK